MTKFKKFPALAEKLKEFRDEILLKKKSVNELQKKVCNFKKNMIPSEMIEELRDVLVAKKTASLNFRHHHVAYCELRGRTRNQIEAGVRKTTPKINEETIKKIKQTFYTSE